MNAIVRAAVAGDLPAIRRVLVETWHATYDPIFGAEKVTEITERWHSEAALREQLKEAAAAFLVAEVDGNICGTLYAHPLCSGGISLNRLYILPGAQRTGAGRALFETMLAKYPGAAFIRLEVEPNNTQAIAFYGRLGFETVATGGACGGDSAAAIPHLTMEKRL